MTRLSSSRSVASPAAREDSRPQPALRRWLSLAKAIFAGACIAAALSGCGGSDGAQQKAGKKGTVAKTSATPMVGRPVECGYFDGGVQIQTGADPDAVENLEPDSDRFFLAVRFEVDGEKTLVPADYGVVVNKLLFKPLAVAFGESTDTFFSIKEFVASEVKLTHGGSDSVDLGDAQDRIVACELSEPQIFLLYRTPGSGTVEVRHHDDKILLGPTSAAAIGFEYDLASSARSSAPRPEPEERNLKIEVARNSLMLGNFDGRETELLELILNFTASKFTKISLPVREFYLSGGSARTNRLFVQIPEETDDVRVMVGSMIAEGYQYDGASFTEVQPGAGGVEVVVKPGRPSALRLVFPNPPFENGLMLNIPGHPPIDVIPAADVLGQIRPAIIRGTTKIPTAPLIGKPVKVGVLEGGFTRLAGDSNSSQSMRPSTGNKYLMMQFEITGNQEFVQRDYTVTAPDDSDHLPVAISCGNAPARAIPGDGYTGVKVLAGGADQVQRRQGQFVGWEYVTPEFIVIWEVPESAKEFIFKHGNTWLTLQPSGTIKWSDIRPSVETAVAATPRSGGRNSGNSNTKTEAKTPPKPAAPTSTPEERAASRLKLGKVLLSKNPEKASKYFEEAIELAPDSPAGKEAAELLKGINP